MTLPESRHPTREPRARYSEISDPRASGYLVSSSSKCLGPTGLWPGPSPLDADGVGTLGGSRCGRNAREMRTEGMRIRRLPLCISRSRDLKTESGSYTECDARLVFTVSSLSISITSNSFRTSSCCARRPSTLIHSTVTDTANMNVQYRTVATASPGCGKAPATCSPFDKLTHDAGTH